MSEQATILTDLILSVPWRRRALEAVAALGLKDCWIGAGFLRAPLWDLLHGYETQTPIADIDVVYFDPDDADAEMELAYERCLTNSNAVPPWPETYWSVRNQARMHLENSDPPYEDTRHAITHWPETPTAIAIRLNKVSVPELLVPFGLDDLFKLTVRPTPHARAHKMAVYRERIARKAWRKTWPNLKIEI